MEKIFFEITVVILFSAVLSLIFRFLRQPSILAFIATGIILGPLGPFQFQTDDLMKSMASIGITLLLFMIGLELKVSELKSVGKTALIAGGLQILATSVFSFALSTLLGFSSVSSLYIALAMSFSSTIIVIKLLSDKKDLRSLYGRITIGILLTQDLVAIFVLIILSALGVTGLKGLNLTEILMVALKIFVLFGWVIFLGRSILPKLLNKIARSSESLFLFSLAWAFGLAALVSSPFIGFSIEIGGLLAGLALANSIESYQIVTKIKPLRDFFLTIFFVTLGMNIAFSEISKIFIPVIFFSLFSLIITPILVMGILGSLKYKKRTSFFSAISLTQISEFSLVIVFLGNKLGQVSGEVVSILTFVGVITFVVSTYLITYANLIYKFLYKYLSFFEREKTKVEEELEKFTDHIVLIGANRLGEGLLESLIENGEKIIVVDFDPDIIEKLKGKNIKTYFGDISDPDIQELAALEKANIIISTVADPDDTKQLLKRLKSVKGPKVIVAAYEKEDAKDFYKLGADYVIMPHIAGGHHLANLLSKDNRGELIEKYKNKELPYFS